MRQVIVFAVVGLSSVVALADEVKWEDKDEKAGACACTYSAPAGWKAKPMKAGSGKLQLSLKDANLTISATPAKTTAEKHIAKLVAADADCGVDPSKPTTVEGWVCGEGAACNGAYPFTVCAQVQPHPAGGKQLVQLQITASFKTFASLGGAKALAAAGAKVTGINAKAGK